MHPRVTLAPSPDAKVMAQLVALAGADAGRVYRFDSQVEIGRMEGGISLNEGDVSRRHARVFRSESGSFWIHDLDSRNGTFVNGKRASQRRLRLGDEIRLGQHAVLQLVGTDPIQELLDERQRFETTGRLALGIAHDFKNMLGALSAGIDYLRRAPMHALSEGDVEECLVDMRHASDRAAEIATKLLDAGRRHSGPPRVVDVNALCNEVSRLARRTFPRNVALSVDVARHLHATGEAVSLHQVLMNLLLNARDAMPEGGGIALEARRVGREVVIVVADSGIGMDESTRARVFEPFFTTKTAGLGFGLGLATVKGIVQRHGGSIAVDSAPNAGTVFTIRLTAAETQPQRVTAARAMVRPRDSGRGYRVLLVDDEAVVRRSYARMLTAEGYDVVAAADGVEALTRYDEATSKPHVVLTDVDMPKLDGPTLCGELRKRDPDIAVVFLSGHDDSALHAELTARGATAILTKPVPLDDFLETVLHAARFGGDDDLDGETFDTFNS
jgi:signal transduction histidine kinase/CheY-like chemotaxis protein